jgi:hypothetical protein
MEKINKKDVRNILLAKYQGPPKPYIFIAGLHLMNSIEKSVKELKKIRL